jgi:hypothetical protein
MLTPKIVGAFALGVPLIILAWALLRRRPPPSFPFALVLILVGLGYLMATGATDDIGMLMMPDAAGGLAAGTAAR